jgi:platelet-activating factor acetylhydrolase
LLAVNSEAFMYWEDNFRVVTNLVAEAKSANVPAWSLTVRGSVHISHSDFSILYPRLCAISFGMTVNPRRALDLNIGASLEFLHAVAPSRARIVERTMKAEGLLALEVVEAVPEDGRPVEERHLGLKIAGHGVARWRWVRRRKVKNVQPGDELWVHLATTAEELRRWEENDRGSYV